MHSGSSLVKKITIVAIAALVLTSSVTAGLTGIGTKQNQKQSIDTTLGTVFPESGNTDAQRTLNETNRVDNNTTAETDLPETVREKNSSDKLSPEVKRVVSGGGAAQDVAGTDATSETVPIRITVSGVERSAVEGELAAIGYEISNTITRKGAPGFQAVGTIAKDNIEKLAKHPHVDSISLVRPSGRSSTSSSNTVVSEGANDINADLAHESNVTGDDVDVAIIDWGFDENNQEIASNVVRKKTFKPSWVSGPSDTTHGTAAAEIVVDTAPNADIHLLNVYGYEDYDDAITWAINNDIDVISSSMIYFRGLNGFKGEYGTARWNNKAANNGITVVQIAGNFAQEHWEGSYTDANANNWTEFSGDTEFNQFSSCGGRVVGMLSWNDWPRSDQDYDLYLYEVTDSGLNEVTRSRTSQEGVEKPREIIDTYLPSGKCSRYVWAVQNNNASGNAHLELYQYNGGYLRHHVPQSSLSPGATAPGAFTVGAIDHDTETLASYSSRGPTNDGRQKPNVVGPSHVTTSSSNRFTGTSAAAPHIAGAAALLESYSPERSNFEHMATMEATADSLDYPNGSTKVGNGLVDVYAALELYDDRPPTTVSNLTSPSHTVGSSSTDQTVDVAWEPATDDVTGVAGYSVTWDHSASTLPDNVTDVRNTASLTSPSLENGSWYVHVRSVDENGNWDDEAAHLGPFEIEAETQAPSISNFVIQNSDDPQLAVQFDSTESLTDIRVEVTDADGQAVATLTEADFTSTNGTYEATVDLADGQYTAQLTTATDQAGNDGADGQTDSAIVDTEPPSVESVQPTGVVDTAAPTITADLSDELSGVNATTTSLIVDGVSVDSNATVTDSTVTYDASGLSDGDHTATIVATDQMGNQNEQMWTFTVDTTAPQVADVSFNETPVAPGATVGISVDVTDSTTNVAVVTVNGTSLSSATDSTWEGTITAPDSSGEHEISVVARDEAGNRVSQTVTLTVKDASPTAVAGQNRTASVGESITVDASNSHDDAGITTYEWDFGNGSTASGVRATHAYSSPGTYQVTLTVTDTGGQTATDTLTVTVRDETAPSITNFTASSSDSGGLAVRFDSDERLDDIRVDVTDENGTSVTTLTEADFTATDGTYAATVDLDHDGQVTATLVNATGQTGNDGANGQTDTASLTTSDTAAPSISGYEVTNDGQNLTVRFTANESLETVEVVLANESGDVVATLTRDAFTVSDDEYSATTTVDNDGTYTATLRRAADAAGNDGADDQRATVTVDADDSTAPTARISAPATVEVNEQFTVSADESTDDGTITAYRWEFGDGTTATGPNATHAYDESGTYTVSVTVTDSAENRRTETETVNVTNVSDSNEAPTARLSAPATVELGSAVTLDATASSDDEAVVEYRWDLDGDDTPEKKGKDGRIATTYGQTGTHHATVIVVDAAGRTDTKTVSVTVEDTTEPTATVSVPPNVAVGESVTITASEIRDANEIAHVCWYVDGEPGPEGSKLTVNFDKPGIHTVTLAVKDDAGNRNEITREIEVEAKETSDDGTTTTTTQDQEETTETTTQKQEETPSTTEESSENSKQGDTSSKNKGSNGADDNAGVGGADLSEESDSDTTTTTSASNASNSTSKQESSTTEVVESTTEDTVSNVSPTSTVEEDVTDTSRTTADVESTSAGVTSETTTSNGPSSVPGFGVGAAFAALLMALLARIRRQH